MTFVLFSCKAQKNKLASITSEDYELINLLLHHSKSYSFLDQNVLNKPYEVKFRGSYLKQKQLFLKAQEVCENEKDIERLKFYCPLADSFKKYNGLLTEEDFDYFVETYKKDQSDQVIDFKKLGNSTIQNHSQKYYKNIDYQNFKITPEINEYPSIRILGVYFTKDKQLALLAYINSTSYLGGGVSYYIFKKQKNIWWKPIGAIALSHN